MLAPAWVAGYKGWVSKQVTYKGYALINQGLSWWCGTTWVGDSLASAKRWVNLQLVKGN